MLSRSTMAAAFSTLFLFLCFFFSAGLTRCRAQSETDGSGVSAPSFKSIAIKTDNSGIRSETIKMEPGQLTVTNETLGMLIQAAYKLDKNQISGAPTWLNARRYDIVASLDNPRSDEAQMNGALEPETDRQSLRALLSDRFKLSVHRETRLVPVFALVVIEGGPKLQESAPIYADSDLRVINVEQDRIVGRQVPIRTLARILSEQLGRPILDATGLRGHYDVSFEWRAESNSRMAALSSALQDQLGLKLELRQVPQEFLVIDHVEAPAED